MRIRHLLLGTTTLLEIYRVHSHCIDIHSRIVSQGLHYVPGGTNPCTLCICDKGGPKWCKSVLCSPPQNCKSFQVGSSCCEFKCLDDILSSHDNYKDTYDVALRFIATTVTAVLSISLLFFLYNRLKRNKSLQHHNHQHEEQRNLSNVGYIAGNFGYNQHNMGYLGSGNNEIEIRYEETSTNFSLWKPPGNYFPPGEAPPPYEEAMRGVQHDLTHNIHNATTHNTLINSITSSYPQEITPAYIQCRHEDTPSSTGTSTAMPMQIPTVANTSTAEIPNISSNTHQYVNVRVQVQHNDHKKHERANNQQHQHHPPPHPHPHKSEASYENVTALKGNGSTSGVAHDRPTSSGLTKSAYHKSRSRSQVILADNAKVAHSNSSASSSTMPDTYELVPHVPTLLGGSQAASPYSRYMNDAYNKIKLHDQYASRSDPKKSMHRTLPKNLRELLSNPDGFKIGTTLSSHQLHQAERVLMTEAPKVTFSSTPKIEKVKPPPPLSQQQQPIVVPVIEVPKSIEKAKDVPVKSLLTYQSLSQDEEDYRSECENCKTANVSGADDDGEAMNETMSLQRRPLSESGYELSYRTSLTLPTHSRKQRTYPCASNTREKWFTSMQQTSSEESD